MGAEIEAPLVQLRPRRRCDDGEAREAARQLDQDRADAAGAADDQQRARVDAFPRHGTEPVEQQFPGGDRGEGKRGGLRERQCLRFAADDALIDQVKFRVGALPQDRARVENLIAGFEQRHVGANRIDHPGGIVAEDLGLALRGGSALAHLVIDRIGGDRLDGDADVAALRFHFGGLEIDQGVCGVDGERLLVSDGLHLAVLLGYSGNIKPVLF